MTLLLVDLISSWPPSFGQFHNLGLGVTSKWTWTTKMPSMFYHHLSSTHIVVGGRRRFQKVTLGPTVLCSLDIYTEWKQGESEEAESRPRHNDDLRGSFVLRVLILDTHTQENNTGYQRERPTIAGSNASTGLATFWPQLSSVYNFTLGSSSSNVGQTLTSLDISIIVHSEYQQTVTDELWFTSIPLTVNLFIILCPRCVT